MVVTDREDTTVGPEGERDALLDRLALIEERPLADRAEALAAVHEELRSRLDAGQGSPTSG